MASGMATIIGPAAGYREFAQPGLNCFQAMDAIELEDMAQYLLSHADRRRELGHAAAQLSSKWTWQQIGQKIEDVYYRILATENSVATSEDKL
jgi:glycosyltransferase involved in cell wall biosynthesis